VIRLAVAIMAHHSRADRIPLLLERLKPCTDVHVEIDQESVGPWPIAQRCWRSFPRDATHCLILQDDVRLCQDFYVGASRAIRHTPNSPIAFYANHRAISRARESGLSWAPIPSSHFLGGVWGQAQCIPRNYVDPFLRWYENRPEDVNPEFNDPKADDWILGQFLRRNKKQVWATVPSLVEHDCPSESLIGFSNRTKVARWYLGDDKSALSVDWSKK
jgi:hypothetical protein